jgi:intracellular multiplication protein IcmK
MTKHFMTGRLFALVFSVAVCGSVHAQAGISRVGQGVQPMAAPTTIPQQQATTAAPPAIATPGATPMPSPLPGGAMPAPANLKQEALDKLAPLSPSEILGLREELNRRAAAINQPLDRVAKPVRRLVPLDISPGSTPEVIRMAYSQGSVISFVDAAGRPWPVLTADNFNPSGFDSALIGVNGVSVGVKHPAARSGSIAVLLEGMNSPVSFSVMTGQPEVDYNVEVQLPRYLPGQPAPVGAVEQIRSLGAADLMNFLLNTPPREARVLTSDSPNVTAWQISPERMIVRTEALVASPAWQRRQSSTAGMSVYDLPLTSRVLIAAQGQMMSVRVSGFAATKEQK